MRRLYKSADDKIGAGLVLFSRFSATPDWPSRPLKSTRWLGMHVELLARIFNG